MGEPKRATPNPVEGDPNPRAVAPFVMTSPHLNPLEQLLRLNSSSPEFNDQVSNTLHGEGYRQWAKRISGTDAVRLIDFLDRVRRCASFLASRSRPCRLSILLTLPILVSGDVCESSGTCAGRE